MKKSKQVLNYALSKLGYTNSNVSKISISSQKNQINFIDADSKIESSIIDNCNYIRMTPSYDIILVMGQSNTCYGTGLDDAPSLRTLSNRYFLEYKKFRKTPPVFYEMRFKL